MKGKMRVYYDDEGDYLEIRVGKPRKNYGDHLSDDIVIFRDAETDELVGIGIFNLKEGVKNLNPRERNLPIDISLFPAEPKPLKRSAAATHKRAGA